MSIAFVMYKDPLQDELRELEREVVEAERQLAAQEALIVDLKRQKLETSKAEAELEAMRANQRRRQQDRHRLLALLQP